MRENCDVFNKNQETYCILLVYVIWFIPSNKKENSVIDIPYLNKYIKGNLEKDKYKYYTITIPYDYYKISFNLYSSHGKAYIKLGKGHICNKDNFIEENGRISSKNIEDLENMTLYGGDNKLTFSSNNPLIFSYSYIDIVDEDYFNINQKLWEEREVLNNPGKVSHKLESVTAQKIIAELNKGTMQSEIAKKFNVSRQYVSQIKYKLQGK